MTQPPAPKRRANGQWDTGSSGNAGGRPKKKVRRIPHPEAARDLLYEIGLFNVPITINGIVYEVPLVAACYITLGSKGAKGDERAAERFLKTWQKAIDDEAKQIADLDRKIGGLTPAYELERDPVRREEQKRLWDEIREELAGMRKRRTEPFPPRRRRRSMLY
jgi:hypothetical protein